MGNRIGGWRKAAVEERYTRPQGLYEHRDIDHRKLRKLILEAKLAPCYPGADDAAAARDLEECPICFLYYPSLNRSKCCSKGICTECFLQMKPSHTALPTQCPFCKTPNYAVEYRGVKTKEERSIEQVEEQKVIEAQIRMRQQALQDEADKMKRKQRRCSSSRTITPTTEVEYRDFCSTSFSVPSYQCTAQSTKCDSAEPSCSAEASAQSSHSRHNRDDNADLEVEDMMLMEAIWRSIQEQGNIGNPVWSNCMPVHEPPSRIRQAGLPSTLETSPPVGFSCAVSALAEHQPINMDYSHMPGSSAAPVFDMFRHPCSVTGGSMWTINNSSPYGWTGILPTCRREVIREEGECSAERWSECAEAGTSYAGSDVIVEGGAMPQLPSAENFTVAPSHLPGSIEEQMMLSMAVSYGRTHPPGLAWL